MEIMVFISTTSDYPSWSEEMKFNRCKRVMEWHDYVHRLFKNEKITHAWGSHQMLSRSKFTCSQGVRVLVYNVRSLSEFDTLLVEDPLRDVSQYVTIPLEPLEDDRQADTNRFETVQRQLFEKKEKSFRKKGVIDELAHGLYRALFRSAPEYVGKFPKIEPKNERTDLNKELNDGDPLEILILGVNPNEMITMWDDTRKFIHYEKVQWWHEYTNMLLGEGKISHVWGTHDFCHIESTSGNSAAAVSIFRVKDYDEFDKVYKLDPIRDSTLFWSIVLQPLKSQLIIDRKRLDLANSRI